MLASLRVLQRCEKCKYNKFFVELMPKCVYICCSQCGITLERLNYKDLSNIKKRITKKKSNKKVWKSQKSNYWSSSDYINTLVKKKKRLKE